MKPVKKTDPTRTSATGVTSVSRALALLDAFQPNEAFITLGELARRTKLHKTTALRIARTMAASRYLVQAPEGAWRLGPAAGRLGARYQASFDREAHVEPVLRELSQKTGESAAFYIREENSRICVARAEGPQALRHHVRIGEIFPIQLGAVGKVLLAFSDEPGPLYDKIRRAGYHMVAGERDPQVASIACPVFGVNHTLIASVAVSGPIPRFTPAAVTRHLQHLRKAASQLGFLLGDDAARKR
jgi:DNA-binding IclR family transcriptional regulator